MANSAPIRAARSTDAATLTEFARKTYTQAFGNTFRPSDLSSHLDRHLSLAKVVRILGEDVVLLAEADAAIIGYVQFGEARSSTGVDVSGAQELRRLYVDAAFQDRGVGAALMDAALEHPRLRNAARIYLEVWEHNLRAQKFYVRYGFKVIGTRAFAVESGPEAGVEFLMVRQDSRKD
ncbi:MAG: GNAT family N-acetyltransferase [Steroidobacter sp.]